MAKQTSMAAAESSAAADSVHTLAMQLFVAAWRVEQDYKAEEIARKSFDAAEVFERVRAERCK